MCCGCSSRKVCSIFLRVVGVRVAVVLVGTPELSPSRATNCNKEKNIVSKNSTLGRGCIRACWKRMSAGAANKSSRGSAISDGWLVGRSARSLALVAQTEREARFRNSPWHSARGGGSPLSALAHSDSLAPILSHAHHCCVPIVGVKMFKVGMAELTHRPPEHTGERNPLDR